MSVEERLGGEPTPQLAASVQEIFQGILTRGEVPDDQIMSLTEEAMEQPLLISLGEGDPITFKLGAITQIQGSRSPRIRVAGRTVDGETEVILHEDSEFTVSQQTPLYD